MVIELIGGIVTNLFSSQLYDGKASLHEKIHLRCFRKKLMRWTRQYINNHDGTVLTTGDFERFIRYHQLIDHIFAQVSSADNLVSKEFFVRDQIRLFHMIQSHPERNNFETDIVLREFIEYFYDEINMFYLKNLSQNEKYLLSRVDAVGHKAMDIAQKNADVIKSDVADIKKLLTQQNKLESPELVWTIYQTLSKSIINGQVGEVIQLYPLLSGKSNDLETSISYLLSLFSGNSGYITDFSQVQEEIIDERIFNDICRIEIYINQWRENKGNIAKIESKNPELKGILNSLVDEKKDDFFSVEKSEEDGITYYTYHVENHYPNEQWIVKRICVLEVFRQPIFNASDSIKQLIENPDNILDKVILLDCKLSELYYKAEIDLSKAKELYDEAIGLSDLAAELAIDFKKKIYEILIRSALLISDNDAERAIHEVPKDLCGCKEIDMLLREVELRKGILKLDDLITICMKYDEYWLFNNYLVKTVNNNPEVTKQLIEKYKFIIDKEPAIFLIYVQLVKNIDGRDKAIDLYFRYQEKYGKYTEFWIDKMRAIYDETELSNVIENYKSGKLNHLSKDGALEFIKLLIEHKMNEDALEIIKRHEMSGNSNSEFVKCKAIALLNSKHEIESLSLFTEIFNSGNHTEEIVYYILALSCNNRRAVSESVISCAEKSEKPQILTLVASVYAMDHSVDKACIMNTKAMLRTFDDQSTVFCQFLGLETLEDHSEEIHIKGATDDTVVYLKSTDGAMEKVYAIHSKHLLPEEPYCWENACHIYKEKAINLGLFRKKTGDIINIDDEYYVIEDIIPLNAFFFRVSMDKVVADGKATMLSIPVAEDGKMDTEQFLQIIKETIGDSKKQFTWLDQYKDLKQIPVTFFFNKQFVRGTYFQLVSTVLEDESILFRDGTSKINSCSGDYIFSYAALIVLFKLGWDSPHIDKRYAIPQALKAMIVAETEEVIRENNREHVSFMGIDDDQLYMFENTEEDKNRYMQDAVAFKSFCERYHMVDNQSDLHLENDYHVDIKDVLGIADYDALVISKNEKRTLVSVEPMISRISEMPEIGVQNICIVDFLSEEASIVETLLTYVRKMVEYKFTVPFTSKTVYCILEFFRKANEEERIKIIDQWSEILDIPFEDELYKEVMLSNIRDCILNIKVDEDGMNPIWQCLIVSWLKYSGHRLLVNFTEEGDLVTELVKVKE